MAAGLAANNDQPHLDLTLIIICIAIAIIILGGEGLVFEYANKFVELEDCELIEIGCA